MPYIDSELLRLLQPFLDELARRRYPNTQVTHSIVAVMVNDGSPEDGLFLARNGEPFLPEQHLTADRIRLSIDNEVYRRETAKRPPLHACPTPEALERQLRELSEHSDDD